MFNLIRGSKLGGIHALQEINPLSIINNQSPIIIFRPLLHVPKSEILDYAQVNNIDYREDSTNQDTDYLRNHLRHRILPEFERINPEYRRAIENYIEYTEELKPWIDNEVKLFL